MNTQKLKHTIGMIPKNVDIKDYNRLIKDIVELSRQSDDPLNQSHCQIAAMLLYELYLDGSAQPLADRSANLENVPPVFRKNKQAGWSYNETFFSLTDEYGQFEDKCRELPKNPSPLETMKTDHPLSRFFDDLSGVFVLSDKYRVYAYRDHQGYLVLLSYIDTPELILAEEEYFLDEPPLWFTEHSHFNSPIWAMKEIRRALYNVILSTGMAMVPSRFELILLEKNCLLLNQEVVQQTFWQPMHLTICYANELTEPLPALSLSAMPMFHLWKYYYPLLHSIAFCNPTKLYEEDEVDDITDEPDEEEDYDLTIPDSSLPF